MTLTEEEKKEIHELADKGMAIRAIARRLGIDRKTVRNELKRPPRPSEPSKIEKFKPLIRDLAKEKLTAPRILREIKARGYTGGKTILKDHLRSLRGEQKAARRVVRRFETAPGKEAQVDWSPFRILIAGVMTLVHCFAMILGFSRRMFVGFYRNEKLPTLLFAHTEAFTYLEGLCERVVYDNQTTVALGRRDGKPMWNPAFLEFAQHYGFMPWVCRPRDPARKGKVERPFQFIESDFLRGESFASWDDLNEKARRWLDQVANVRHHSTLGRKIDEAFAEEKPFLIALPSLPFPSERREGRKVGDDGTVCVDGSFYPAPASPVGQWVTVRVSPVKVEVLDRKGEVTIAHKVPDRPMRLPYDFGPPVERASASLPAMEARFLSRFPEGRDFLDGLKRRMSALTPVHLRQIERLSEIYGEERVKAALDRASAFGNFNAAAVQRILEAAHPTVVEQPPAILPNPAALGALDDIDPGSPKDYTLDSTPPTEGGSDDQKA